MAQSEYVKQRLENIARTQKAAEMASTRAAEVYGKAVQALEQAADFEKSERDQEGSVDVTFPIDVAIEVYCGISRIVSELQDRIDNDLRRDHRMPSPLERKELERLRIAVNLLRDEMRASDSVSGSDK